MVDLAPAHSAGAQGVSLRHPPTPGGSPAPPSAAYQIGLTALLSLNFGFVLFDRNASSFLMPFIQPDLRITNTQVGMLSGALSLTWSIAAFGVGVLSDWTGSRKGLLILATLAFSLCSFSSGVASGFAVLLGTRLLMGIAEGGIMPLSQSLIASAVDARHRGLAMGVAQGFGSSFMGSFVAPVMLVAFAQAFGWRHAFFIAGAPGLILALLLARLVRAPRPPAEPAAARTFTAGSVRAVLTDRNVVLCAILSILLVSYLVVCWAFMPLYLTRVRGYDAATMGWLMGSLGISATLASFVIPAISDRIGRRGVMIAMPLIAVLLPLSALYYRGSIWEVAATFVVGWLVTGVFPLFMSTVPSESVAPQNIATALWICMGTGELIGGVLSPFIAGYAADRVGLAAPLWIMLGLAVIGGLVALGVRETAPRLVGVTGGALRQEARQGGVIG
jgi:MFS transporter, ACS family, hexuronate transporter